MMLTTETTTEIRKSKIRRSSNGIPESELPNTAENNNNNSNLQITKPMIIPTTTNLDQKKQNGKYTKIARWLFCAFRMLLYVTLICPGFFKMVWKRWVLKKNQRMIKLSYGESPRHGIDIYLPDNYNDGEVRPSLIFVSGGAWMIGYNLWASFLGQVLAECGVISFLPDYRNYPAVKVDEMMVDIENSISWVFDNVHLYGGNRDNIYLVAQSAGAHLSALLLAHRTNEDKNRNWKSSSFKAFIGISGVYNFQQLELHLNQRGLGADWIHWVTDSRLDHFSPLFQMKSKSKDDCKNGVFPKYHLMHGAQDNSVPMHITKEFEQALRELGVAVELKIYENATHTSPVVEDQWSGYDEIVGDILKIILQDKFALLQKKQRAVSPRFLMRLARLVNPF